MSDTLPVITNVRLSGQEPEKPVAPIETTAPQPEVVVAEVKPEETPKPEAKEPAAAVTPEVVETKKIEVKEPAVPETKPEPEPYDWYKEHGFDETHKESIEKFLAAVKANKTPEFYEIASKDYDKVSDLEMMRMEIREKNEKATAKQLEILERKELEKRGIDLADLDSQESLEGLEILALDMDKAREGYKTKQKEYTIPTYEGDKKAAEEAAKVREDYINYLNSNEDLRAFERDKSVSFGDVKVSMPEDLNLRSYLENPNNFWALFDDGKGGIDVQRFGKTVLVALNPDNFHSDAVKLGISSAEKAHFDETRNPKIGSAAKPVIAPVDGRPNITNVRYTGQG